MPGVDLYDSSADEMVPLTAHAASLWTTGFARHARLARLGAAALAGLAGPLSDSEATVLILGLRSAYVAEMAEYAESAVGEQAAFPVQWMDPSRERLHARYAARLVPLLLRLAGLSERFVAVELVLEDQAGLGMALERANTWIESRRALRAVVGGLDSLVEPGTLAALDALRVLKTPENASGLAPGEAAAFALVEPPERAASRSRALIDAPAHLRDRNHALGDAQAAAGALSEVIGTALKRTPLAPRLQLGSLDGTTWAAAEWGLALTRLPRSLTDVPLRLPATSFGNTGAAAGVLALACAAHALSRDSTAPQSVLVWLSAPCGSKSAVVVRAAKELRQ